MQEAGRARRPGRPPSSRARRAVLEAALATLAEGEPGTVTIDAIAARAGVSKATIYRHWSCKQDICKEAVAALQPEVPAARRAADPQRALVRAAAGLARALTASQQGHRVAAIAAAAAGDPVLTRIWEDAVVAPHRDRIRGVLTAAALDGSAYVDLDVDLAAELVVAPVLRRLMLRGPAGLEPYARDVAVAVWSGCARPRPRRETAGRDPDAGSR